MDFDGLIDDFKSAGKAYSRRARQGGGAFHGPGGGPSIMKDGKEIGTQLMDNPKGIQAFNRNSAVGQVHSVISKAFGGSSAAGWGTGAGMAVAGLGANSMIQNSMANNPGAAPAIGTAGAVLGAAAFLDPAIARGLFKSGSKAVSKVGKSVSPGAVEVS